MSFFKKLFGSEDQPVEPKPRVWPKWRVDETVQLSPEELQRQKFYYSRVFLLKNDDDRKRHGGCKFMYVALTPSLSYRDSSWRLHSYAYNDGDHAPKERGEVHVSDPVRAVQQMLDIEQGMIARGNVPLEGSTSNFHLLAISNGDYINGKNEVFHVDGGAALSEKIAMPRTATQAFYHAAGTTAPTSSWEWFYERYVDSLETRFFDKIEKLRRDPNYAYVTERFARTQQNLRLKEDAFAKSAQASIGSRVNVLSDMIQMPRTALVSIADQYMAVKENTEVFSRLVHLDMLVTILRAGAHVVDHEEDMTDRGVNYEKLKTLQAVRKAAQIVAMQDLKMGEAETEAVVNVMLRGADPRKGALPLETFFKTFPPVKEKPGSQAGPKL